MLEENHLFRIDAAIPNVGAWAWIVPEDRLVWSAEVRSLFGISEQPDAERGFLEFVHPDDRVRVEAEIAAMLGRGDTFMHDYCIIRPDGGLRAIHSRGVIDRDANGAALRLRGVAFDMSGARELFAARPVKLFPGEIAAADDSHVAAVPGLRMRLSQPAAEFQIMFDDDPDRVAPVVRAAALSLRDAVNSGELDELLFRSLAGTMSGGV